MVTGRRSDAAAPVTLAGHLVPVSGQRKWRVAVPLRTVREWSSFSARTLTVRIGGDDGKEAAVPLPIGLLGSGIELASLEVRAH